MPLQIFHPAQMFIYEQGDINTSVLKGIFLRHPDRTVYATVNKVLVGIITIGDFVRFQCNRGDLIQKQYRVLKEQEAENVNTLFERHKNIISIPVTKESGEIIYEFYKEKTVQQEELKKARELELAIEKEYNIFSKLCSLYGIYKIIFTGRELCEEKNRCFRGGGLWHLPFEMLLEQNVEKDTLIIDVSYGSNIIFLHERYCIFNGISYLKRSSVYGLLYCNMEPFISDYELWLQRLSQSFRHIAVVLNGGNQLEKEFLAYADNEPTFICQTYEKEELVLKEGGGSISINGLKEMPEIMISFQLTEAVFCARFREKEIPFFLFYSFFDAWNFCDYDIAWNIIPELRQNGVKLLAFSIPEEDEVLSREEQAVLRERTEVLKLEYADEAERIAFYEFAGYGMHNGHFFQECCTMTANRFQFGFLDPINYQGDYFNSLSGCRYTAGIPTEWEKRIFMFGPCTVRGFYVRDEDTIASVLQRKIGKRYCVLNLGAYFQGMNYKIRQYGYQPGDVVIICVQDKKIYKAKGIEVLELTEVYRELTNTTS